MKGTDMRTCTGCDTTKPLDEFGKNQNCKDDKDTWCKTCRNRASAEFRRKRPDYMHNYYNEVTKPRRRAEQAAKNAARYQATVKALEAELERAKEAVERANERVTKTEGKLKRARERLAGEA